MCCMKLSPEQQHGGREQQQGLERPRRRLRSGGAFLSRHVARKCTPDVQYGKETKMPVKFSGLWENVLTLWQYLIL